eukprot:scaffold6142_cov257-Pinguiococcus_pyrenoidosus.AAC.4
MDECNGPALLEEMSHLRILLEEGRRLLEQMCALAQVGGLQLPKILSPRAALRARCGHFSQLRRGIRLSTSQYQAEFKAVRGESPRHLQTDSGPCNR